MEDKLSLEVYNSNKDFITDIVFLNEEIFLDFIYKSFDNIDKNIFSNDMSFLVYKVNERPLIIVKNEERLLSFNSLALLDSDIVFKAFEKLLGRHLRLCCSFTQENIRAFLDYSNAYIEGVNKLNEINLSEFIGFLSIIMKDGTFYSISNFPNIKRVYVLNNRTKLDYLYLEDGEDIIKIDINNIKGVLSSLSVYDIEERKHKYISIIGPFEDETLSDFNRGLNGSRKSPRIDERRA